MWTLFLIAALAAPQVQQGGGTAAAEAPEVRRLQERVMAGATDPLELTLAAPVQLPNGRRVGATMRPAASAEAWLVYTRGNLCQSVITHGPMPEDATEGWKVTVTERSRTTAPTPRVMVSVTWSRMWERGRPIANASGGSSELTLQRGDRIALDTITRASEPGVCAGTTKSLELQVGVVTMGSPVPAGDSPLDGVVDVELWMVHKTPGGTETVEHQIVRLINGAIGFGFRGAPIDTSAGQVAIELTGQLKAVRRDDGSRGLWASLTRGVTRLATGTTSIAGPTTTTAAWLAPGDVVELNLPPIQFTAGRSVAGGGGGGGAIGGTRGSGTGAAASGGQATSGGGAAAGGVARGSGGATVSAGRGSSPLPNLLEGHQVSLRVRLIESNK